MWSESTFSSTKMGEVPAARSSLRRKFSTSRCLRNRLWEMRWGRTSREVFPYEPQTAIVGKPINKAAKHAKKMEEREMSKYCIFRTEKHKSVISLRHSLLHAFREQHTPNADPARTPDNTILSQQKNTRDAIDFYNEKIKNIKVRKNAVYANEFFIGASPEIMQGKTREEQDAYFADALEYMENWYGKENIISSIIHRDETTPHLSVFVVPIDEKGKLNSRHFIGGTKDRMEEMQSDFYSKVGAQHRLERGSKERKAQHTSIKEFYRDLNRTEAAAKRKNEEINELISTLTPFEKAEITARIKKKRDEKDMQNAYESPVPR